MKRSDLYFVGALVAGSNIAEDAAVGSLLVLFAFYVLQAIRGE